MRKKLVVFLIAACLTLVLSVGISSAAGTNNGDGMNGNGANNTGGNYTTNAATDDDNDSSWGWLGLIGLLGLTGLRKQHREQTPNKV